HARCMRLAHAAGTWALGTARNLFATTQLLGSGCFDGHRYVRAVRATTTTVKVLERDAGDTTTTERTPPALGGGTVNGVSVTYDEDGDLYLYVVEDATAKWTRYDRAAGT